MAKKTVVVSPDGSVSFNSTNNQTDSNQIENKENEMTDQTASPINTKNSDILASQNVPTAFARKTTEREFVAMNGVQLLTWKREVTSDLNDAAFALLSLNGKYENPIDRSASDNRAAFAEAKSIIGAFNAVQSKRANYTVGYHVYGDDEATDDWGVVGYVSALRAGKGIKIGDFNLSFDPGAFLVRYGSWARVSMVNGMPEFSPLDTNSNNPAIRAKELKQVRFHNMVDLLLQGRAFKVSIAAIRDWVAGVSENAADANPVEAYRSDVHKVEIKQQLSRESYKNRTSPDAPTTAKFMVLKDNVVTEQEWPTGGLWIAVRKSTLTPTKDAPAINAATSSGSKYMLGLAIGGYVFMAQ